MISINIPLWLFAGLAIAFLILAIVSAYHNKLRRMKVLSATFLVCLVVSLGFALTKNHVEDSGQVVTAAQAESRLAADAENISKENGLTSVMDDHGKTVVYPSELVKVYADPTDERIKRVNVTTRTEEVTKGVKVLGVWLVCPNAESIVTSVTFD